jgi:hypothetical protein
MVIWQQYKGSPAEWDEHIEGLSGNFYQTYGWGEARNSVGWKAVRILAFEDESIISAVSILVKSKAGIGVLWIPGGPAGRVDILNADFIASLRRELRMKFFYCRINSLRTQDEKDVASISNLGWTRPKVSMTSGLTMTYSLDGNSLDRLQRTSGNWRHNLKRSGRYGLKVENWTRPDIAQMSRLYREMEALKSLPVQFSVAQLTAIFTHSFDRVVVFRCLDGEGNLLAIRAAGYCGASAIDLLAAAGESARKVYASHATLWGLLDYCSCLGLRQYDLGGVDPVCNKGVYDFKHGTGASLTHYLGEWECASLPGLCWAFNFLLGKKSAGNNLN